MSEESRPETLLAMVALNTPEVPDIAAVLASFHERCPDASVTASTAEQDGTVLLHFDDTMAVLSFMPAPIPWSDLEGPCALAWWWQDATECMQQHEAHIIVALLGSDADPISRHIRLSHLVAAVAAQTDAAGIYWGSGTLVHEPAAFTRQSADLSPESIAPHLWIGMRLLENEDGTYRFSTNGLESFDHKEIEIDASRRGAEEILDFCYGVILYLLTSGTTIEDGETIGRSAHEKIPVHYKPSMWDETKTVMNFAFA